MLAPYLFNGGRKGYLEREAVHLEFSPSKNIGYLKLDQKQISAG